MFESYFHFSCWHFCGNMPKKRKPSHGRFNPDRPTQSEDEEKWVPMEICCWCGKKREQKPSETSSS